MVSSFVFFVKQSALCARDCTEWFALSRQQPPQTRSDSWHSCRSCKRVHGVPQTVSLRWQKRVAVNAAKPDLQCAQWQIEKSCLLVSAVGRGANHRSNRGPEVARTYEKLLSTRCSSPRALALAEHNNDNLSHKRRTHAATKYCSVINENPD